eukprot:617450-Rhodomonas_salina.1
MFLHFQCHRGARDVAADQCRVDCFLTDSFIVNLQDDVALVQLAREVSWSTKDNVLDDAALENQANLEHSSNGLRMCAFYEKADGACCGVNVERGDLGIKTQEANEIRVRGKKCTVEFDWKAAWIPCPLVLTDGSCSVAVEF